MPVTRSEAMFFTGGLIAGVAAVAAFPWLKKQYEMLQDQQPASGQASEPMNDIGRKLSETVEEFMKNAPGFVDAGKSGLQAGFDAACRMARTMAQPDDARPMRDHPVTEPNQAA